MVSLGLVAIDGAKVKAQASAYGARTHDALNGALKAVEEDIGKYMAESAAIDQAVEDSPQERREGRPIHAVLWWPDSTQLPASGGSGSG